MVVEIYNVMCESVVGGMHGETLAQSHPNKYVQIMSRENLPSAFLTRSDTVTDEG